MKPAAFEYHAPRAVDEALDLLAAHGDDAKVLAGGQSLVPLMNMRLARPRVIVDINRTRGLAGLREAQGMLRIGSMVRQRAAERSALIASRCPLLRDALTWVGHPQIRNRGTVGGSVAHADPAAEIPAVLAALGGEVTVRSTRASRTIRAADLFVTYLTTAIDARELLTEVRVPVMPRAAGWSWMEIARRHGDFALAGVGVMLVLRGGVIADARIGLTGVGPTPVRAEAAERLLARQRPAEPLWRQAADAVRAAINPDGDIHASADYRRHVAGVLTVRALREAYGRAGVPRRSRGAKPPSRGRSLRPPGGKAA
ncbi:MAG TPA: xanthine dehydrogenase family protein subunit M [bacterium]|nr:xanthine dehydrogenase family protein subunit M [bacterium]